MPRVRVPSPASALEDAHDVRSAGRVRVGRLRQAERAKAVSRGARLLKAVGGAEAAFAIRANHVEADPRAAAGTGHEDDLLAAAGQRSAEQPTGESDRLSAPRVT